ncbi:MAG TPA: Type 1 glutamine amidotransferase-like domain-containing protein, partial [Acidimicrobiales bacterium]|nr:Type 1 glutamine amidotransferase-like domain-containing protein [Acidimicrobiales bacterium]
SPLHLRSVLKGSAVWEALLAAWRDGAIVAGSSAGAMVLTDSMIDPRGGGFSLGLGLVEQLAVIPHHQDPQATNVLRSVMLAPAGLAVAGIPERTALIWDGRESGWREAGAGHVTVYRDGAVGTLADLPA